MLKSCITSLLSAGKCAAQMVSSSSARLNWINISSRSNSILSTTSQHLLLKNVTANSVDLVPMRGVKRVIDDAAEPHRLLRYHRLTGRRTSVDIVPKQFYRLHWGAWIRTRCGRDKQIHRKSSSRMREMRKHVFCTAQQCTLLDKLVSPWYKERHYYIDDPYAPYHTRDEFLHTRRKPLPPIEDDYRVNAV